MCIRDRVKRVDLQYLARQTDRYFMPYYVFWVECCLLYTSTTWPFPSRTSTVISWELRSRPRMGWAVSKSPSPLGEKAMWSGSVAVSYTHLDVYKRQGREEAMALPGGERLVRWLRLK